MAVAWKLLGSCFSLRLITDSHKPMTLSILNLFLAVLVVGAEHALENDEVCVADECTLHLKQLRAVKGHVIDMNTSAATNITNEPTSLIEQTYGPDVIFHQSWTMRSHQVWDSHHCRNAKQTMLGQGRRELQDQLLQRTSYYLSHSGVKDCSSAQMGNGQNFGQYGRYQASLSKQCKEAWKKTYGRVPQGFHFELNNCRDENYDCHEKKDPWTGKSTSWGGLDYVCNALLMYLDHHV